MEFWADRPIDAAPAHGLIRPVGDLSPEWWDWRSGQWVENDTLRGPNDEHQPSN
jgi:hypothetical protein